MAKKSIEDVMNEIEDFINSCSTKALSSNKVIVPRDEFDDLFGELKVKIPAEIDRCKKIMRNKEAILMDARKTADEILADASAKAQQMVSETAIMAQANQVAYETVEMARKQANDMLGQAVTEANEIRLGSMQYTNDIMLGLRNYMEATIEAERANYENMLQLLNNNFAMADANLAEIQNQIVEFTGNPNSVTKPPVMRAATTKKTQPERIVEEARPKTSMMDKVKHAVTGKEDKEIKEDKKSEGPGVNIPDFITSGEKVVPNETPLEANVSLGKKPQPVKDEQPVKEVKTEQQTQPAKENVEAKTQPVVDEAVNNDSVQAADAQEKKVKKVIKKRNPVLHTPQTAQETVAKTVEAAASARTDKTIYKANGEQAREVAPMEGRVKRGPRVGRPAVDEMNATVEQGEDAFEVTTQPMGKSMGVVDDYSMPDKV